MDVVYSVSKEVAKVAKEKGFKEETLRFYLGTMEVPISSTANNWNVDDRSLRTAAPIHQQLIYWFRKCYEMDIYYRPILEDEITYNYIISQKGTILYSEDNLQFTTHREALNAAFLKAFEMI